MRLPSADSVQIVGQRLAQPAVIIAAVAVVLVAVSSMLTMYVASVFAYSLPMGILALVGLIVNPYAIYIFAVVQPVFVPIQSRFLFAKMPDALQFLAPAVFLASLVNGWRNKEWKGFRMHVADIFVLGFIFVGYAGIFLEPGHRETKMFTNHQVLPAMMYFIVRWQSVDRKRFRQLLQWHLTVAAGVLFIMLQSAFTHKDPFYYWPGSCGVSRGPYGDAATASACTSFLGAMFVYAFTTQLGGNSRRLNRVWVFGCIGALLAVVVVAQRSGLPSAIAGIVLCMMHPRMVRYSARMVGIVALVGTVAYFSFIGANIRGRYAEENAGWRRTIYREKAIRYIENAPRDDLSVPAEWDPILGTGYERLMGLSDHTIPDREVFDPGLQVWRSAQDVAKGSPIHCAPLTMYGEYGWAGMFMIGGLIISIVVSLAGVFPLARKVGRPADTQFMVALFAVTISICMNAILHNTDKTEQVAIWVWNMIGLIVAHPHAFVLSAEELAVEAATRTKSRGQAQRYAA